MGGKMRTRLMQVGLVGVLLILGAGGASAEVMRWQVDGDTREAIVYAPTASQGDRSVPLVLSFHGYGDNMQNFQHTNMHVAWPDAVVVYFQGLERRRGLPGWQVEQGGVDRDLKLVDVALASLRERVQRRRRSDLRDRLLERWDVYLPAVGGAARRVCRLRPGGGPPPSLGPAPDAQARLTCGRRARSGGDVFGSRSLDRARHRGERRWRRDDGLWGRVHGPRTRDTRTVMTWIHSGGHVYPRSTAERIVSFFRDHSGTR